MKRRAQKDRPSRYGGALSRLLCLTLALAFAALVLPTMLSAQPSAAGARDAHMATKCKDESHAKHPKRCKATKKKHKRRKRTATKPKPRKTTTPSHGKSPASQPTVNPSPANLTPAERALFEAVNKERAEHGVAALSTSAPLQAISEKRAHEMAEMNSDYAGHDVYVDIKNAGLCTKSQREISGVGISQAGKEAEESHKREIEEHLHGLALVHAVAFPALAANSLLTPEEEEIQIPIEAKWVVLGVGVVESGSFSYYTEDFAEPC
jgi:hypothetical protein